MKREKHGKNRRGANELLLVAGSGFTALLLFVALIAIQRHLITRQNTSNVYVVKNEIVKGITITEENISNYFVSESRLTDTIPSNAIYEKAALLGKTTLKKLTRREILLQTDFADYDYYEGIENPVVISIKVSTPANAVSGTLRAGDVIDIKWMTSNPGELGKITEGNGDTGTTTFCNLSSMTSSSYEIINQVYCVDLACNIRVKDVYTAEAVRATADTNTSAADATQIATMINIVIPRSLENTFLYASDEGTLKITKVVSATEGE